jgi:hypothetical protein
MRQIYVPYNDTYRIYKQFFHGGQEGSGYSQGYIYSNHQVGGGLGGFLRGIFNNYAVPLGKKLLYKGWDLAKPELKKVAKSGTDALTRIAQDQIDQFSSKAQKKFGSLGKRRKVDALGS